ncbi:MAG TPA: hypothetical protein VF808_10025 [Ktedonobacterales bacterium]
MADETSMALDNFLWKARLNDDVGFLREGMCALAQTPGDVQ